MFLNELCVKPYKDNERKWELTAELHYISKYLDKLIAVPNGFVTDFASVPRWLPLCYTLWGTTAHRESVVHDYLLESKICTRSQSDKVFLEAMKSRNKSIFIRYPMYLGVRIGTLESWIHAKLKF